MALNLKPEPFVRCYGWRVLFGLSLIADGLVYLLTLTVVRPSCALWASRRLAQSRNP